MKKRAVSAIVALAMTLTLSTTVLASPSSEITNLTQAEQYLNDLKTKIQTIESNLLDVKLKQDQTQQDIANKQSEIEANKAAVEESAKKVEESKELFNNTVKTMYKNGNQTILNVIFESNSLGDLIDRVESIKTITKHDKEILDELKVRQADLEAKQGQLNSDMESLNKLQADYAAQVSNFEAQKAQDESLVGEATALRDKYQIDEQKETVAAQPILAQVTANVPDYEPSRGAASMSGGSIVAYAQNFLGTPYVWGGTSPSGFDCSGFVQYVFNHFGISLSRTTYSQVNQGQAVSPSALQPGDLVFFGPASSPYHVGIYVGGGMYIHAPETGDVVKISSLSGSHGFSVARRVG